MRSQMRGFTLMEIVIVIVLLGVMALFTTQFIGSGTRLYVDAAAREQLMNDVRFGVERLNRELRDAIPGSVSVAAGRECVTFWPVKAVTRYLQAPVSSASTTLIQFLPAVNSQNISAGDLALIYPAGLDTSSAPYRCSHGACALQVASLVASAAQQTVTLQAQSGASYNGGFATASPGQRVYYADRVVSYCQRGSQLQRSEQRLAGGAVQSSAMADDLQTASFSMEDTAFNSSGEVMIRLLFSRRGESIQFSHLVEVVNVP